MKTIAKTTLLESLEERWKAYRAQYRTCRSEFSDASVHDLRVSTRRLLAALDLVRAIDPHPRVQKVRRALKNQMDDFDELRDVQVMLVEVAEDIDGLPQLSHFRKYLKKREASLLRTAYKDIKDTKISEMSERIKKTAAKLEKNEVKDRELGLRLIEVADNAYARARQDHSHLDVSQIFTIHSLRLSFKKFRYLVEVIHPLVKGFPESHFERMHKYQSAMGDIQDAEIFLNAFSEYAEKHASLLDAEPVFAFYKQNLSRSILSFMEDKDEFNIFWQKTNPQESKDEPVPGKTRHRRGSRPKVRAGQPETVDREGPRQDEEDRSGDVGAGNPAGPDPEQPGSADDRNSEDRGEEAGREEGQVDPDGASGTHGLPGSVDQRDQQET
jgi:CHAD domain-containing protein